VRSHGGGYGWEDKSTANFLLDFHQVPKESGVGRSDMDEGQMLEESHTYEKCLTYCKLSHKQATNNILSHFYQLI
jgi:hypothetical protein